MDLFNAMNIPKPCAVGNTIFKKQFYDNADLSKTDKDLFINLIDKIIWEYCLKPDTIRIPPYKDEEREYPEIEIIRATVNSGVKTRRIAEIIMRTIPYPMLLIFEHDGKIQLYAAHQRTNLADSTRNTIEEFIFTDWIALNTPSDADRRFCEGLDITKFSYVSFFQFYGDLIDRIIAYNATLQLGVEADPADAAELKAKMDRIAELDKQIADLRSKAKKETQFNRRVELNVEIKQLEKTRNDMR